MTMMPKGTYYIGDPCYLFDESSWGKVIAITNYFKEDGRYDIFGKKCFVGGTKYGDGTYDDNYGREYGVDAGLIGILPIELIEIDNKQTLKSIIESDMMHIETFTEDFNCDINNGFFRFGKITIDTDN